LSRTTVRWLKVWLEHAGVEEGAVFRRLIGKDQIGGALNPGSVALIFKRVAQWIGMPARYVAGISGHSTRVGATQDLAAITQAGGWKLPRMPLQYAEKINEARSGMARAAEQEGRDSITEMREQVQIGVTLRFGSSRRPRRDKRLISLLWEVPPILDSICSAPGDASA
jgi:hypothetical protein